MKKGIIVLVFLVFLTSCGQSQSDIDVAKQKILEGKSSQIQENMISQEEANKEDVRQVEKKENIQIIPLDANSPLSFDTIDENSFTSGEVVITGKASQGVDKIEVFFSNPTSKYPDDRYILQTYTPDKEVFKYVASSRNKVLDFGQNEYIFRAYSGISENETKVILTVPYSKEEIIGTESQLIGLEGNTVLLDLPTSSKYGDPMKLGEASFTYTQIKGLEINKEIIPKISCDTLTEFLTSKLTSWYYWNTCREIVKDKGIKFNVIRLVGDTYIYERHYIDFANGFYGTYELETGTDVTSDNIAEKNNQLKQQEFPSLEVVDDLMKDIVNS